MRSGAFYVETGPGSGANDGVDFKRGRLHHVLFYRTLIGRTNDRFFVFLRKAGREMDVESDFFHHACNGVVIHFLDDLQSIGRQAALLAKRQNIDACACAD